MENNDLNRAIEKGNKKLALFSIIWTLIGSIFLLFAPHTEPIWPLSVIGWMIWVLIGISLAPKFYKFYK